LKIKKIIQGQQGFTLVEILVALLLVVGLFTLIPTSTSDEQHSNLETSLFDIERAVRFAANEAILRNSIVRISMDLDKTPPSYTIEFSTTGGLVLPEVTEDINKLSLREQEELQKKQKNLDSQFSSIDEFSEEGAKTFPRFITVLGYANTIKDDITLAGVAHIYFYPTGERDASLIFLSSEEEFASLSIPAYENAFERNFSLYTESDTFNIEAAQENLMKETFEKWLKE
jgi:prepilin-type N-terminal cleavage/methylation domain-containing protein